MRSRALVVERTMVATVKSNFYIFGRELLGRKAINFDPSGHWHHGYSKVLTAVSARLCSTNIH